MLACFAIQHYLPMIRVLDDRLAATGLAKGILDIPQVSKKCCSPSTSTGQSCGDDLTG